MIEKNHNQQHKIKIRKRLTFQERFKGKIGLIDKEGSIGMIARSSVPIKKGVLNPPANLNNLDLRSPSWINNNIQRNPESCKDFNMKKRIEFIPHSINHYRSNSKQYPHKSLEEYQPLANYNKHLHNRQSFDYGNFNDIEKSDSYDLRLSKNSKSDRKATNLSMLSSPSYSDYVQEVLNFPYTPLTEDNEKQVIKINQARYKQMLGRIKDKANQRYSAAKIQEKSLLDIRRRVSYTTKKPGSIDRKQEYPWFTDFDQDGRYEECLDNLLRNMKVNNKII